MIDISLLRVLSTRESFDKLYTSIPTSALEKRTQVLIADISRYYKAFPDHKEIDFVQFRDLFKLWHPNLDTEQLAFYSKILTHAEKQLDILSHSVIVNSLLELHLASSVAQVLEQYNNGDEVDLIETLVTLTEQTTAARERKLTNNWIKDDLDALVQEDKDQTGLTWRIPILNEHMRPIRAGDFIVIAGRPDTGKTTFLTSELSQMATQLDDRPILWLNNESDGKRILKRMAQSALNATIPDMVAKSQSGTLTKEYADTLNGDTGLIRVIDIHDFWNWQVAELIETHKPKLVVMDMIDNIKFQGLSLSGGARTDQVLEEMYKWARIQGVKHECVIMATSQISADGEGMQFPTKDMLKDSKTGKQGACDVLLMIGRSNDPAYEHARFLGTPKNKLRKVGKGNPKAEVIFDEDRARYYEPREQ